MAPLAVSRKPSPQHLLETVLPHDAAASAAIVSQYA